MKKIFPLLLILLIGSMVSSCVVKSATTAGGKVVDSEKYAARMLGSASTGFIYALVAVEINTNVSSLLIDKTKEKIVSYKSQVAKKLTPGEFIYVIPPRIYNGEKYSFDDDLGRMITNYLAMGKYAIPVTDIKDADYVVVTNIKQSLSKFYGTNYSEISFSILNKMDMPVYVASIRVESKSDRNFWYFPAKKAMPVAKLTIKGLAHIMAEGLPEAHGDVSKLVKYARSLTEKKSEEN